MSQPAPAHIVLNIAKGEVAGTIPTHSKQNCFALTVWNIKFLTKTSFKERDPTSQQLFAKY